MARQHIHPNSNGKFYRIHEDTNTYIYLGIEKPWFPIDVPLTFNQSIIDTSPWPHLCHRPWHGTSRSRDEALIDCGDWP